MLHEFQKEIESIYPDLLAWRRYFHQNPELSFHENNTSKVIAAYLREFGLTVKTGVGGNGVIGILEGENPGKTIAFRADFDALPITDEKETEYKSKVDGVMHACGHDGHTATLLGVARVLSGFRYELKGRVVFIFQHAEEKLPGGALSIIEEGVLDKVDAIFGAHLFTDLPVGKVATKEGPLMAAVDVFKITIHGKGGHGAKPHEAVDSIVIGSQVVTQLQQIVSRRINPMASAVVTVGVFQAGTAFNVIADKAYLEGTVRSYDPGIRQQIEEEVRRMVKGVSEASHAQYEIEYTHGYPAVVNHKKEAQLVQTLVEQQLGKEAFVEMNPRMVAEDFAYYLQKVPGAFFFIGGQGNGEQTQYSNHHPRFDFDEQAMLVGAKVFLGLAHHYLMEDSDSKTVF